MLETVRTRIEILLVTNMIIFFIGGSLSAQSKNIFVSKNGNDQNNGFRLTSSLLTINKAIDLASAGDTIYILPGTYKELLNFDSRKGLPEKPICVYGYSSSPNERPIIDGGAIFPSSSASSYWMVLQNSDWIEVGNLNFKNGWTDPISVINSSYITFNGCYFFGGKRVVNASGLNSHHLLVQNCYWDQGGNYLWTLATGTDGIDAWTSMHEGAMQYYNGTLINFSGTGGSIVIRNNTIVNAFNGIRWTAQKNYDSNIEIYNNTISNVRDNDFEPEYYTYNLLIYNNRSHNIHKTMSVDHVNGGCIYYYGNRITSDKDSWSNSIATSFWKVYGDATGNLSYPMFAFNNSFCAVGKAFAMDAGTVAIQFKHYNNAYYFTGNRGWYLDYWSSTNEFDYDISNKDWPGNIKNNSQETHGRYSDVNFNDVQNFDLRLQSASPAKDAGKIISLPELGWIQSFEGSAPDIGAFEGDNLTDGPAFRFRTLPEINIAYKEKPRITRSKVIGNKLDIYFSDKLDPATVSQSALTLRNQGVEVAINKVSMLKDNYLLEIETGKLLSENMLSIQFSSLPKGANGETATLWASTLGSYKKDIVLYTDSFRNSNSQKKSSLEIYPNPFNNEAKLIIRLFADVTVDKNSKVLIYDLLGREIQEIDFSGVGSPKEIFIDGSKFSSGIYFAVLNFNTSIISKKFIVMK